MYFNGLMDSQTDFSSIGPGLFLDEFDTNTLFSGFEGSMNYPPTFPTLPPHYPPTFLIFQPHYPPTLPPSLPSHLSHFHTFEE